MSVEYPQNFDEFLARHNLIRGNSSTTEMTKETGPQPPDSESTSTPDTSTIIMLPRGGARRGLLKRPSKTPSKP